MNNIKLKRKNYDLEERTYIFANRVNTYVRQLPYNICNKENGRQLVRSSGSVAANYIEANECLGKRDFIMRIKISKKEAKESRLWLRLTKPTKDQVDIKEYLMQEATELMNIFGAIQHKSK